MACSSNTVKMKWYHECEQRCKSKTSNSKSMFRTILFTACKTKLREGNIFTRVCYFVHKGSVIAPPPGTRPPRTRSPWTRHPNHKSGGYASYWNAFLFLDFIVVFGTLWTPFVVTARTQSLGQGNVFRSVYHSAHMGGGGLPLGGLHPGGLPTEGLPTWGSPYGWGSMLTGRGLLIGGDLPMGGLYSEGGFASRGIGQTPLGLPGGWASEPENRAVLSLRECFLLCIFC